MKKSLLLFIISAFCMACAGTPPQWWNPSGSYGHTQTPSAPKTVTAVPSSSSFEEMPIPAEEAIAPAQNDPYEEMILTPLQDEETEESSSKSNTGGTMDITPSSEGAPAGLPPPSVLE